MHKNPFFLPFRALVYLALFYESLKAWSFNSGIEENMRVLISGAGGLVGTELSLGVIVSTLVITTVVSLIATSGDREEKKKKVS